jgi:predicted phosphate transport protein (TIGR00153 family)
MILFKKEKEVIELILKHLDLVEDTLKSCLKAVEFYLGANISEGKVWARKTRNTESEADLVRYDIRDKLYLGAYMPLLREDIYKLVESMDRVCNAAEACSNFFFNQRPLIPDEMKPHFLEVSKESLGVIDSLKLAILCYFQGDCKMETVREHTKDVGMHESRVDKFEWDLTKEIFTAPSLDFAHKHHLKSCLDAIVEVSDRAEDAGDQLELATLKSMV